MHKPAVLLVDNNSSLLASFGGTLEREGYKVLLANNEEEALGLAQREIVHLAVVDIRLINDRDENDYSGLHLAASLGTLSIPRIVLTGQWFSDPGELVRRVMTKDMQGKVLGSNFIWKHEGPEKVLDAIRLAFRTDVKLNPHLKLKFLPKGLSWQTLVDQLKMFRGSDEVAKQKAQEELKDLTCRLFLKPSEVRFRSAVPGHSQCTVALVQQIFNEIEGKTVAIKFGPRESIAREEKRFWDYVKPFVERCTDLELGPVWSRNLGAMAYSFVGERAGTARTFLDYYQSGEVTIDQLKKTIGDLFQESCKSWYNGRRELKEEKRQPLDILYRKYLNLQDETHVNELKNRFEWLLKQKMPGSAISLLETSGRQKLQIQITERLQLELPNPIRFALEEQSSGSGRDFFPSPLQVAITHGDLHSSNIMVSDAGRIWLIDFYKTGWGHVLRDFTELESDIKFTLFQSNSLRDCYQLEQAMIEAPDLLSASFGPLFKATPAQTRALETIQHLRELAYRLTVTDGMREYLIALLFYALKRMVGFSSTDSANPVGGMAPFHALLSAAMICERLETEARKAERREGAGRKIFLSYAGEDRDRVERLHQRLFDAGLSPWVDHKDIVGGEDWDRSIKQAIHNASIFIACLSRHSVGKRGFIQKEVNQALDIAQGMLPQDIYIIPVMLEDCELPERLAPFQAVRLYEPDGWSRLLRAIEEAKERRGK